MGVNYIINVQLVILGSPSSTIQVHTTRSTFYRKMTTELWVSKAKDTFQTENSFSSVGVRQTIKVAHISQLSLIGGISVRIA